MYKCVHFFSYTCRGEAQWDDGFDLNVPTAQIALSVWKCYLYLSSQPVYFINVCNDNPDCKTLPGILLVAEIQSNSRASGRSQDSQ